MKWTTECPGCKAPLTVWRVMAAPTPFHVKCKKCDARLRTGGVTWPSVAIALLLVLGLAYGSQRLEAGGALTRRNAVILLFGLGAIFELVVSLLVVNRGTLTVK